MSKSSFLETTTMVEPKLYRNVPWMMPYKVEIVFMWIRNSRWLPPQDLIFNIGPDRKINKAFSHTLQK
jgi:hypothetical protein